jgi:hypothetical protein
VEVIGANGTPMLAMLTFFLLPYAKVLTKRRVFQLINAERGLRR